MVQLTHPFLLRCIDPVALLRDCLKLNTFLSSVEKQALAYGKGRQEEADKYKGWALEIFAEFLIKSFPVDKRIGITDYKVVADNDDVGVDGFGKGSNGKPATVQVKFRPADWSLTANDDHLSNFTSASQMHYGVNASDPEKNMLIVTTMIYQRKLKATF